MRAPQAHPDEVDVRTRGPEPGGPGLVGRADDIAAALDAVRTGAGGVLWVGGPGSGRTRLLAHVLDLAAIAGADVVRLPPSAWSGAAGAHAPWRPVVAVDAGDVPGPRGAPPTRRAEDARSTPAGVRRGLLELLASRPPGSVVVLAVDDVDTLTPPVRDAVVDAVLTCGRRVVVLATGAEEGLRSAVPGLVERPLVPLTPLEGVELLHLYATHPVAPHVAVHLVEQLDGAPGALLETATLLEPAQLRGLALLPDPLPVAPSVRRAVDPLLTALTDGDLRLLLTAAVDVGHSAETVLRACATDMAALLESPAAPLLHLVAGRVRVRDPRVRAVVHARASLKERTEVHRALAQERTESGDVAAATWHRALSALAGDVELVPPLLAVAGRMLERGEAVWAQRVALEAASHASAQTRAEALALAGRAALHAGHVADAESALRRAARLHTEPRPAVLDDLGLATRLVTGQDVPAAPGGAVGRALAVLLHVERCAHESAPCGHRLDLPDDGVAGELARAVVELASGRPDRAATLDPVPVDDPLLAAAAATVAALALSAARRTDEARAVLARLRAARGPVAGQGAWTDLEPDVDHAGPGVLPPLARACTELAEALVEARADELDAALTAVRVAACRTPVTLCWEGAAALVAGRLATLRDGRPDALAAALERLLPARPPRGIRAGLAATARLRAASFGHVPQHGDGGPGVLGHRTVPAVAARPDPCPLELWLPGIGEVHGAGAVAVERRRATSDRRAATATPVRRMAHAARAVPPGARTARGEDVRPGAPAPLGVPARRGGGQDAGARREPPGGDGGCGRPGWAAPLTERELEVARTVAAGGSNRDVARVLGLSVRTVEVHLTSIFRKVGVRSRTELALRVLTGGPRPAP
ncbi:helix-turn-helix transcriptional regulator [Cellulomonas sp. APG4]|uniref:helix-turn-helix transcriptional regulator n=1 Tax=Cellulomonas sp. APG4 TaxID=1538656 RepID=UPI001379DFA1|nr:helix-turn-helix transcriptional regulator [Cellulomonas sp. APG4]